LGTIDKQEVCGQAWPLNAPGLSWSTSRTGTAR